jgi:hypothetical protein
MLSAWLEREVLDVSKIADRLPLSERKSGRAADDITSKTGFDPEAT